MRHEFKQDEVERLLVECHRRCCICHRYCGVKIEVDHIEGAATAESGDINNAIPLCFDCHAEVKHYNPKHPKGRKLHPSELRAHRDQWLRLCKENPEMFVQGQPPPEAGSLERLLSELEFNRVLASAQPSTPAFEMAQFRRAISDGTFTWLPEGLKSQVHAAYSAMMLASSPGRVQQAAQLPIEDAIRQLQAVL